MSAAAQPLLIDEPDRLLSHIEMLDQLARTGFEIAEAIGAQVKTLTSWEAAADPAVLMSLSRTYDRVVRTVRFTMVLHDRLVRIATAQDRGAATQRKTTLVRIVKRIAETQGQDGPAVSHTGWKATERLDRDDIYGDVLNRPVSELIAAICKDLDLSPDWPTLAQEAWARDEITNGHPGWPLARPPPRFPSPLAGEGGRRSLTDEGAHQPVGFASFGMAEVYPQAERGSDPGELPQDDDPGQVR